MMSSLAVVTVLINAFSGFYSFSLTARVFRKSKSAMAAADGFFIVRSILRERATTVSLQCRGKNTCIHCILKLATEQEMLSHSVCEILCSSGQLQKFKVCILFISAAVQCPFLFSLYVRFKLLYVLYV